MGKGPQVSSAGEETTPGHDSRDGGWQGVLGRLGGTGRVTDRVRKGSGVSCSSTCIGKLGA